MNYEEICVMLQEIALCFDELNDWEEGFIGNMEERVANGESFSLKEINQIETIHERIC